MVYLTGDIHGDPERVVQFCLSMKPRRTDTIILLGDVAANYTGGHRDEWVKQTLEKLKINILCIHGITKFVKNTTGSSCPCLIQCTKKDILAQLENKKEDMENNRTDNKENLLDKGRENGTSDKGNAQENRSLRKIQ